MNRIGSAWAFAVLVGGTLAACSSSSGSSGGNNNITGPSCMGGAMPPVGGSSQTNSACDQCVQSKCGSASGCVNTDCSGYVSCYCACQPGATSCYTNCFGQLSSGSCGTCISNILSCETQSCASACSVTFDAGLLTD